MPNQRDVPRVKFAQDWFRKRLVDGTVEEQTRFPRGFPLLIVPRVPVVIRLTCSYSLHIIFLGGILAAT